MQKRLATASGLLVAVVVLAACGGSGDRVALERTIQAAVAETGPEGCLKFETLHFLESTSGLEGKAAIRDCEEDALDLLAEQPRSVDVSRIDVEGAAATALVAFKGSLFDGQKVRYAFVERGGGWKFDEMTGFVDLDSAHLILLMGRDGLLRAESPREAENVACWIGRMERMSDSDLEELLLGGSTEPSECIAESSAT